jgi:hypothetical protein
MILNKIILAIIVKTKLKKIKKKKKTIKNTKMKLVYLKEILGN